MAKRKTTGSIFRQIPLLVAMLAAFVFSASNGLQPLLLDDAAQAEQVQDQDRNEDNRPEAYVDYACDAIAPAAQLQFFQASFKIPLPELQLGGDMPDLLPSPRGSDHFFRILFRLIISPNAP